MSPLLHTTLRPQPALSNHQIPLLLLTGLLHPLQSTLRTISGGSAAAYRGSRCSWSWACKHVLGRAGRVSSTGMPPEHCLQSVRPQGSQAQHSPFSCSYSSRPPAPGQAFCQKPAAGRAGDTAEIPLLFPDWAMCFILFLLDLLSIM